MLFSLQRLTFKKKTEKQEKEKERTREDEEPFNVSGIKEGVNEPTTTTTTTT